MAGVVARVREQPNQTDVIQSGLVVNNMSSNASETTRIDRAAAVLLEQFNNKQKYLLDDATLPQSLDEAYAVQEKYQGTLTETYGPVDGYKIAYTTTAVQQATGLTEPCAGVLLASNIRRSPAILSSSSFLEVGIECEVAARVDRDLPASGAPYDRVKVSEAVDAVMTAFEVVDNRRTQGQPQQVQLMTSVASNILNAGVVLGAPVLQWQGVDLTAVRGSMEINGELVGEGYGSDVMGHPLEPLAWLANMLAAQGKSLTAGMIVITGSIVPPKWLKAGDTATIAIDHLGSAEIKVE